MSLKVPDSLLDGSLDSSRSGRGRVSARCVDKRDLAGVEGLLVKGVKVSRARCLEAINGVFVNK